MGKAHPELAASEIILTPAGQVKAARAAYLQKVSIRGMAKL
jgi:hypothetical protein